MWIDVCGYLCCKKNQYKFVYSYINHNNIYQGIINASNKTDIWNHCEGITENDLIQRGNSLFTCLNCNYHSNTFKDFINNYSTIDNNNDTHNDLNITRECDINNYISIMFFSTDQSIHYPVVCKLTDTFDSALDVSKITYKVLDENNRNVTNDWALTVSKQTITLTYNKTAFTSVVGEYTFIFNNIKVLLPDNKHQIVRMSDID